MNGKPVSFNYLLILSILAANTLAASPKWTDNGPDHLWSTPANWDLGVPTTAAGADILGDDAAYGPVIDNTVTAISKNVNLKSGSPGGATGTLTMTGGTLDPGDGTPYTKDNPWNGNLWLAYFNTAESGRLDLSGGDITCGYVMVGGVGAGTLNMTGGHIDCFALEVIASNKSGGSGRMYLDGGLVETQQLNLKDDAIVDVNGGTLVIDGNATATVMAYFNAGKITAKGSNDPNYLKVLYDDGLGRTTVTYDPTAGATFNFQYLCTMAKHWLATEYDVNALPPNDTRLQAYYMFEETSGAAASDSSGNNRHATVDANDANDLWDPDGYDGNGCIIFDGNSSLLAPADVFANISNQATVAVWLNHDMNEIPDTNNPLEFRAGDLDNQFDQLDWNATESEISQEQWYHYAFVKNANDGLMKIYLDGLLVARDTDSFEAINGAQAGLTKIGAEADANDTFFLGKMDDFRIYDYALSQAEVLYLAAGPAAQIHQPLQPVLSPIDPYPDGIVNLKDFAVTADNWLQ